MIRAGTYAKANISSRSWLQTPVTPATVTKNKRSKVVPATIHPIFEKCAELTNDPLWKDLFLSASKGKLPKGFSYKDGVLFHRKRTKTTSVEVSDNAIEALEACRTFLRSMGGIASQQEHSKNDSEDATSESRDDTSTESEVIVKQVIWSKIVPKKNRSLYLYSFILHFAEENGLIPSEIDKLQKMLNLGESLNLLNDSNVIFTGNAISEIHGLSFDGINRIINFEPINHPIEFSKKQTRTSKAKSNGKQGFFLKIWDKYLTTYTKNKINASAPNTSVPTTGAPKTLLVIRTSKPTV